MAIDTDSNVDSNAEPQPLKLRSYQQEMFERSLEENTIVVMETGSGKTAVAIYRIMHALETIKDNKLVWFMTEGVALCRQQHDAVRRAVPDAVTRIVVGADGPELWGQPHTWEKVLNGVDVVFSTFAVLQAALAHAYVRMTRLALIIFDEAHHVTKDHPSNLIMKECYWNIKRRNDGSSLPMILGLTASPAENGKEAKLKKLEANLDAICKTPRMHRLELRNFVHRPTLERLAYEQPGTVHLPPLTSRPLPPLLNQAAAKLDEILDKVRKKVEHLVEELGWWAASTFVEDLVLLLEGKLKKEASNYIAPAKLDKKGLLDLLRPLAATLVTIHTAHAKIQQSPVHISAKAQCFLGRLNELVRLRPQEFVGIVFVRQRVVTAMLDKLLACHPDVASEIKSAPFVGESNSASYEKQIWELVVPRTQVNALHDFRSGTKNLIVATDALDEGIDVAACNTIICFDPPRNLRSFVQKRGRARKQESTYTIMVPAGCPKMSAEKFQAMEALMTQLIDQEKGKIQRALEQEEAEEDVDYILRSNTTEAYVTAKSVRAHLEHFCAKLPRIPYTDPRPTFTCEPAHGLIVAKVQLPLSVPSIARTATSERAWETERAAIKDAAFQAYKGLYRCNLLTEHLLAVDNTPIFNEDFKEQQRQFHHLGPRLCVWDVVLNEERSERRLFRTSLVVHNCVSGWMSERLALWTYNDLSSVGNFRLFAEEGQVLTVDCQPSVSITITSDDVSNILSPCTRVLVMAARSKVLSDSETNSAVYITPDLGLSELQPWLQRVSGEMPAQDIQENPEVPVRGLIVNLAHGNSLHIFRGWHAVEDETGQLIHELECSPFPRRRNFLKMKRNPRASIQEEDAERADNGENTTFFDAEDCLVKMLPITYSWVMRLVPSIFHHIEMMLVGERLQKEFLSHVAFKSSLELVRAVTSPSTQLQDNYERLEFLGDSLLKFHTSQQLFRDYPQWHEEYLTRQRNTIISNISLAKTAVDRGIDRFIIQEPFVGKDWTVPTLRSIAKQMKSERHLRMKNVADVMESLIGAAFLGGGMDSARRCMSTLLPDVRQEEPILDMASGEHLGAEAGASGSSRFVKHAELVIGHSFQSKHLVLEGLTHASCTRDSKTESYQRLEFLGDAVLDYLVVTAIFSMLPNRSQGLMTRIKAALVNGDFLAFLCYSSNEILDGVTYTSHGKNNTQCEVAEKRQSLWMMMRYNSEDVENAREEGVKRYDALHKSIKDILQSGKAYPWEELCMLRPPKFISDIVESVLGAIFVDSNGNLEPCRAFLEKIGLMTLLRRVVHDHVDVIHPREKLNRLLGDRKMEQNLAENADGFSLSLVVDDKIVSHVAGCCSKDEAIIRGSNMACKLIEDEFGTA